MHSIIGTYSQRLSKGTQWQEQLDSFQTWFVSTADFIKSSKTNKHNTLSRDHRNYIIIVTYPVIRYLWIATLVAVL